MTFDEREKLRMKGAWCLLGASLSLLAGDLFAIWWWIIK